MNPLTSSPLISDAARHLEAKDAEPEFSDDPGYHRDLFLKLASEKVLRDFVEIAMEKMDDEDFREACEWSGWPLP